MNSPFTDEQIDFMRADLASDMGYTRMIEATKKRFKEEGRDFDAEFKEWDHTKKKDVKTEHTSVVHLIRGRKKHDRPQCWNHRKGV